MTANSSQIVSLTYPQSFPHLNAVILATGQAGSLRAGTPLALWPLSRTDAPYELTIPAGQKKSLLAQAIERVKPWCEEPLIIATTSEFASAIAEHIAHHRLLKKDEYQLLVETFPRGHALTLALAAATLRIRDPRAVMLTVRATQSFEPDERWRAAIERLYHVAVEGNIAVLGSSETAGASSRTYGCIKRGPEIQGIVDTYQVASYLHHPDPAYAYRASGRGALWSTQITAMRADVALSELKHASQRLDELGASASRAADMFGSHSAQRIADTAIFLAALGSAHWSSAEARQILSTLPTAGYDQLVFESCERLVVVATSIMTSDYDSFMDLQQSLPADIHDNRVDSGGNVVRVEAQGTTVLSTTGKLIATVGTRDLIIVDTPDATLVISKNALDATPSLIAQLRALNAPELHLPGE